MFRARYALSPYIKQTRFVFKGLTMSMLFLRILLPSVLISFLLILLIVMLLHLFINVPKRPSYIYKNSTG
jgi:hypothetical protein